MTIKVKITISLDVDKEDYHLPADEDAGQEIENSLTEFLYDIDGVKIKSIALGSQFSKNSFKIVQPIDRFYARV